jgi:hypothetical protein
MKQAASSVLLIACLMLGLLFHSAGEDSKK